MHMIIVHLRIWRSECERRFRKPVYLSPSHRLQIFSHLPWVLPRRCQLWRTSALMLPLEFCLITYCGSLFLDLQWCMMQSGKLQVVKTAVVHAAASQLASSAVGAT